jgi:N-acetylglutamate synthase-like GNAT family acetyltransferase
MNVNVRPAQMADVPALTKLCAQLGYPASEAVTQARLETLLSDSEHALLVAETEEGKVVGWVHGLVRKLLIHDVHIEIGGLVVDEAYRGRGVGEKLMAEIEAWAKGKGIQAVFLRSNIIREEAHEFYEKVGYEMTKTSKIFWKYLEA